MQMSLSVRVQAGDPDAFRILFDENARSVYNHGFRLTGDWSTAEEITALTFLEAWRLRSRVEPDRDSLRPWLLGITTNVARNASRAARRHRAAMTRLPAPGSVPDFVDDLVERIDDTRRTAQVRAALSRLSRAEQDVFHLCVWSGLDYAAAAVALRVPVGTVRSRLARARKKLRKIVDQTASTEWERESRVRTTDGDRTHAVRSSQEMSQ